MVGMVGVEVEHLGARAEAEAEDWNHWRALQPAAAGCARDDVAVSVGHRDGHRVPSHGAEGLRASAGPVALTDRLRLAARQVRLEVRRPSWTKLGRSPLADQAATGAGVSGREQLG